MPSETRRFKPPPVFQTAFARYGRYRGNGGKRFYSGLTKIRTRRRSRRQYK
ncbi:TPA: hypothetical protein WI720_001392 [Neisseria meningitidis]